MAQMRLILTPKTFFKNFEINLRRWNPICRRCGFENNKMRLSAAPRKKSSLTVEPISSQRSQSRWYKTLNCGHKWISNWKCLPNHFHHQILLSPVSLNIVLRAVKQPRIVKSTQRNRLKFSQKSFEMLFAFQPYQKTAYETGAGEPSRENIFSRVATPFEISFGHSDYLNPETQTTATVSTNPQEGCRALCGHFEQITAGLE